MKSVKSNVGKSVKSNVGKSMICCLEILSTLKEFLIPHSIMHKDRQIGILKFCSSLKLCRALNELPHKSLWRYRGTWKILHRIFSRSPQRCYS